MPSARRPRRARRHCAQIRRNCNRRRAKVNEEQVLEQLRTCYDPEIPVNIVDLGLVYDLQILPLPAGGNRVEVKMTLTAPGCGMGPILQQDVETKVSAIPGVKEAAVFLVWDPPWNRDMLSEAAKLRTGHDVTTPPPVQPAPVNMESLRKDFPILDQHVHGHPLVYLDNAATSQKPRAVIDALDRFYDNDNANVHRGIHELSRRSTVAFEAARDRAARLHQCPRIVRNYFHARHNRRHQSGRPHLGREKYQGRRHHSADGNGASQQHRPLAIAGRPHRRKTGLRARDRRRRAFGFKPPGRLCLTTSSVKLFAFTHVSNTLGTVNPVADLCAQARRRNIVTLVDAAQSAGHRPVDVQEIGCDFLAFSGHKLCGPTGIGVLYGRRELLEDHAAVPRRRRHDRQSVDYFSSTWKDAPHKFEAGTPEFRRRHRSCTPRWIIWPRSACDKIARHDQELSAYAYEQLSRLPGIRLFGPKTGTRPAWSVFLLKNIHAHDVVTVADQYGVALRGGHHCNQPLMKKLGVESTARASFYFYNTAAEVDRLFEVLTGNPKIFRRMTRHNRSAKHDEARPGSFSGRATGLVPPLSHRRLRQLRVSAGRNAGGPVRAQ